MKWQLITEIEDPLGQLDMTPADLLQARREWIVKQLQSVGRNDPLRVLISTNSLGCGGAQRQALFSVKHLRELGLAVEYFYYCKTKFMFDPLFDEQESCSHFLDKNKLGQWRFWKQLVSLIRKQRYDIVQAYAGTANFYVRGAAALARTPVIMGAWRSRCGGGELESRVVNSILNLVSCGWLINSKANIEALSKFWWSKRMRIYVLPNAVEFDDKTDARYSPLGEEVKQWATGRMIVGAVGRITYAKNFDLFLDVAKQIASYRSDVCFCVVGGADESAACPYR